MGFITGLRKSSFCGNILILCLTTFSAHFRLDRCAKKGRAIVSNIFLQIPIPDNSLSKCRYRDAMGDFFKHEKEIGLQGPYQL